MLFGIAYRISSLSISSSKQQASKENEKRNLTFEKSTIRRELFSRNKQSEKSIRISQMKNIENEIDKKDKASVV